MKRCTTCNRTYTDRDLSFCIDDGTPLITVQDDDATVVSPSSRGEADHPSQSQPYGSNPAPPVYQPPGSYVPVDATRKRSAWPWIIGILALALVGLIGFGVAGALLIPRVLRSSTNRNQSSTNVNSENREGENVNSNLNLNTNENTTSLTDDETGPPTDSAQVLSDLTDLEHEWTVANINADKKALARILADDYVGITNGRVQGKAEYIETIKRDTSIEKWEFQDLSIKLVGDRATLTGILRLVVNGQEARFRFTDKFVWRDKRWQATGSEVTDFKNVNN